MKEDVEQAQEHFETLSEPHVDRPICAGEEEWQSVTNTPQNVRILTTGFILNPRPKELIFGDGQSKDKTKTGANKRDMPVPNENGTATVSNTKSLNCTTVLQ